jgi:hypothetical protein
MSLPGKNSGLCLVRKVLKNEQRQWIGAQRDDPGTLALAPDGWRSTFFVPVIEAVL